ncbi:MAG: hypothetical protein KF915_20135 [Polyangiaceae bacterium]|nr:hypothetical protein [Polyangiaceae bacterium]
MPSEAALHAGLVRSLEDAVTSDAARALATTTLGVIRSPDSLEASIRVADGQVRGGRMMIERAPAELGRAIARSLGVPRLEACERVIEATEALSLPLIVGWDVASRSPLAKLYANASDAGEALRAELARRLGYESQRFDPESSDVGTPQVAGRAAWATSPPHVVGLNAHQDGAQVIKLYHQHRARPEIAVTLPSALRELTGASGWVVSHDLTPTGLALRAVFAATRHQNQEALEAACGELTGQPFSALAAHFPFPVDTLRQLGWSPRGVTLYAKPAGTAHPVHALEPAAVFSAGAVEVGLFIEPSEHTPRAYLRTRAHALSFRARSAEESPTLLAQLGAWAAARVSEWEALPGRAASPDLSEPPAPWRRLPSTSK